MQSGFVTYMLKSTYTATTKQTEYDLNIFQSLSANCQSNLKNFFRFTVSTGKKDVMFVYNTFSNIIFHHQLAISVMCIFLWKKSK